MWEFWEFRVWNEKCRKLLSMRSEPLRAILTSFRCELVLVANIKVVALFVSFPTSICASPLDFRSPSYDRCNERLSSNFRLKRQSSEQPSFLMFFRPRRKYFRPRRKYCSLHQFFICDLPLHVVSNQYLILTWLLMIVDDCWCLLMIVDAYIDC